MPDRLFTPRFFIMFGYSFTVFVSVFQLLPTAPYHIIDLGGSIVSAGLFHGLLTYSSALSASVTGPLTDRIGHRPVLIATSLAIAAFTISYAFIPSYKLLFAVVFVHGIVWSALLAASGAYMTATIPPSRRAEGLGYWGLASVLAVGAAPALGFWVYRHGWTALCLELASLNLLMAAIAWFLPDDEREATADKLAAINILNASALRHPLTLLRKHIEWRVLLMTLGLALITCAYGGLTSFSAMFADELGVSPRSLFLTAMAVAMLLGRLTLGRRLDQIGHRRVLVRAILAPALGLLLLVFTHGPWMMALSAILFGVGFGLVNPAYTALVLGHVSPARRGAAFGAMLTAFDAGIGTGASLTGALIHAYGFRVAFGCAAGLAGLSLPYFLFAERRLGFADPAC